MVAVRRKVEADRSRDSSCDSGTKSSILAHDTASFWWKVTQVALPVVLATILGFGHWLAQSDVDPETQCRAPLSFLPSLVVNSSCSKSG